MRLLCISSYKYVAVSSNNTIQSNCAVCLRYSYLCLSPLPTVSLCGGIKQEREEKCFCVMKTPSLFLSLSVSHSFSISLLGQFLLPASDWEERGLAGWLATRCLVWAAAEALFPSLFEAGFVSLTWLCLCLQLFCLLFYLVFHSHVHTWRFVNKKHAKP